MKRAVITAAGIVSAKAIGVEPFWQAVKCGESAMALFTRFDPTITGCTFGGEVPPFSYDFIPEDLKPRRMARHTVLLLKAAEQIRQALPISREFGVRIGLATSDSAMIAQSGIRRVTKGLAYIGATSVTQSPPNAAVGALGFVHQPKGEVHTVGTACAAGLDAIGLAARDIVEGRSRCVIAGGSDSPLGVTPIVEFVKSGLASTRNQFPSRASRPFDVFADSGVLSEAAAVVLVEELESAQKRGASVLGEIIGYGNRSDSLASRPGSGYAESMMRALDSAGLSPDDVDYVSAWGPGHPVLDEAELEAILEVFGPSACELPVSSIKGVTGNPLAAAGPSQVIAVLMGMAEQVLPPTANLEAPLDGYPMHFVRSAPLEYDHKVVLVNAHGLGGANTTLILKSWNSDFNEE